MHRGHESSPGQQASNGIAAHTPLTSRLGVNQNARLASELSVTPSTIRLNTAADPTSRDDAMS